MGGRSVEDVPVKLAAMVVLGVVVLGAMTLVPASGSAAAGGSTCNSVQVSAPRTVLSNATLKGLGLNDFPDIQLGVTENPDGTYKFLGTAAIGGDVPSHPQRAVALTGTLDNPAANGAQNVADIKNLPAGYTWQGGGPVYVDPTSGVELQMLHFERYLPNAAPLHYYTDLHLGRVDPVTNQTTYLGPIITANLTWTQANTLGTSIDMGAPTFVPRDGYLYVYFRDYLSGTTNDVAVARAPIADVVAAAQAGTVSPWAKYYNGAWNSSALGGLSTNVYDTGQHDLWSPTTAYDQALGSTLIVSPVSPNQEVLTSSVDGMTNWTAPIPLFSDPDHFNAYMTLVPTGDNSFYVYYLQWNSLSQDWSNAQVLRRTITCSAAPSATTVPLGRYNNNGHHVSTTQPAMTMAALQQKGEYSERSGGTQLFTTQQPGTHALYSCLLNAQDYFLSAQFNCAGVGRFIQIDGWLYDNPTASAVPLYRCYTPPLDDHFVSTDSTCEGAPNTTNEGVLGYAPWVDQILYAQYSNGTDHQETSGPVGSGYTIDRQWVISTSGTRQLYNCQYPVPTGIEHFTSTQPNCEGQTKTSDEGYLYTTPSNTPLYRCYDTVRYDHFLAQTSDCDGVPATNDEGLLGYALTRS
jgi:hypothetical protein